MKKFSFIASLLFICSFVSTQNVNAQSKVGPTIISAEVNVNTGKDYNSLYSYGNDFIQGFYKTMISDIAFDITFNTGDIDRKIKKINITSQNRSNGHIKELSSVWSTSGSNVHPLIVYSNGSRIVGSWQSDIRTFVGGKTHKIKVYAQPNSYGQYTGELWKSNQFNNTIEIFFSDGTVASINDFSVVSANESEGKQPIIERAEIVSGSNPEIIAEKDRFSSIVMPSDTAFDLDLNMNGTNKTISYIAIKKSPEITYLWSTNQSGKSGTNRFDDAVGDPSMDSWVQPFGLLVIRNNQKLNNPYEKNKVITLGTYSGQSKISFRLYAFKSGPDFTDDSEIYVVFSDGTIISKKISSSNANSSLSNQTQDAPKIISAEVNVDTGLDMLSVSHFGNYSTGYFNQGFYETMIEDIAFDISFSTGNGDRKIKKITVSDGSSIWATFIHEGMPLLVYSDGVRIYDSRQPDIRTFPRNKINKITVYAQPKNKNVYSSEYWKNNTKSSVKIFFTDGTVASTPVISVSSTPTKPVVKPIIEKAQLINQSNHDLITEKGSLSSFGIPGDVVFDVDINMNGTSKTIAYFAIKKSSQSTNLWSTNQSGISGSGLISSDEVTILPYGLLVTKDNQKLNNPLEKKRVITLGTYSGQSKISFRLYADKYAGPDFTDDSEIYIVFNDGTIISKKISVSNANSSLSSTDPVITKVTLSDNSTKSNSIRESMYGNSKYWLWNIDLDLKNINRNISFISISMRNQRWSTDETYGSLLTIYDNGKVISNSSRKILGALGTGTKKLTVYGLKENDARYDISNAGTVYIAFDDGFVISYALSNESVTNLLENIDIEFPVLPQNAYLNSGYNAGEGLVLEWKPSTDNVGVAGYKIYRAEYITPARGSGYTGPFVVIGDTKNAYFTDNDPKLDKSKYYSYYVRAYDLAGNLSYQYSTAFIRINDLISKKTELKIDKARPSAPQTVVAKYAVPGHINLSWNDSSDDVGVLGYKIYRDGVQIGTLQTSRGGSFNDYDIKPGNSYTYNISAYDAQMNESVLSSSVTEFYPSDSSTISTKDQTAPTAPYNLTTRAVSASKIDFSWPPSTDNVGVAGYKVYRDEKEISTTKGTSYSDTGLQPGSAYSYYIRAFDVAGNTSEKSSYLTEFTQNSTTVTATKDTQTPSYPPNLVARAVSSSQMDISWSPSTDNIGVAGYIIYRNNVEIGRTTNLSYRDNGLSAGTDYSYNVKAYDAAGNQSYMSNSVTEWTLSGVSQNNMQPVNYLSSVINAVTQILLGKSFTK
jgi:chitodextrinase